MVTVKIIPNEKYGPRGKLADAELHFGPEERRMTGRYIVTRMVKDRRVPKRYQRAGWKAFDTRHIDHGQVWPTKAEAQADADWLNRR